MSIYDYSKIDGFPIADLAKYSLHRAIDLAAQRKPIDGLEGEVSKEMARRSGLQPRGFYFPSTIPVGPAAVRRLESRTLLNTSTGSGAIPTILDSDNWIESLRAHMFVAKMGATLLPDVTGTLAVPKQTATSTPYWISESNPSTESEATIGSVVFSRCTVAANSIYSRLFLKQTSLPAEAWTANELARTLATEIDRAAINGSGSSNQPTGILQQSGLAVTSSGTNGGVITWANALALESAVAAANADGGSMGYLTTSKVRAQAKNTVKTGASSGPIWTGSNADPTTGPQIGNLNDYLALASNNVPSNLTKASGSGLSAMIFGNWQSLMLAFWGPVDVLVDSYGSSNTGNVKICCFQDCDVQVRHIESFAAIVDIQA